MANRSLDGSPADALVAAIGPLGASGGFSTLAQELQQLASINDAELRAERRIAQMSQTQGGGGESGPSAAERAGSAIADVLGFGLGLGSLIAGLSGLFGGGDRSEPPALIPYLASPAVNAEAGVSSTVPGIFAVDTAGGVPRAVPGASVPAQITVNVQAMDSRSFLDHSNDIALAVRQAMLESSVLSDVIREV